MRGNSSSGFAPTRKIAPTGRMSRTDPKLDLRLARIKASVAILLRRDLPRDSLIGRAADRCGAKHIPVRIDGYSSVG